MSPFKMSIFFPANRMNFNKNPKNVINYNIFPKHWRSNIYKFFNYSTKYKQKDHTFVEIWSLFFKNFGHFVNFRKNWNVGSLMPRKYIIVYDIFEVIVTVHPISRNPAHQLATRKKMDILNRGIARRTIVIL